MKDDVLDKKFSEMIDEGSMIPFLLDLKKKYFIRGIALGVVIALICVWIGAVLF